MRSPHRPQTTRPCSRAGPSALVGWPGGLRRGPAPIRRGESGGPRSGLLSGPRDVAGVAVGDENEPFGARLEVAADGAVGASALFASAEHERTCRFRCFRTRSPVISYAAVGGRLAADAELVSP